MEQRSSRGRRYSVAEKAAAVRVVRTLRAVVDDRALRRLRQSQRERQIKDSLTRIV